MECDELKTEQKMIDDIKEELFDLFIYTEKKDETGMGNVIRNAKDPKEAVAIIKEFEELLKGENKRIIKFFVKQGKLLKKF